ncbi:unnamed protein product [Rotaria magnacalcarata]|uniref:FLYWCH-type domain-containing protein n=1 Tax=Rotaria magnacalcarata TaxID=392030 RepID=A0A814XUR8_9BILA|nr:unnamed protein product [Rotaria magnacalcarata]CAF2047673.1 unnamed protein product [Rotaria magnacalcarata]CAF2097862.1 unnamed protein product [Rotaria magnacalcarata]
MTEAFVTLTSEIQAKSPAISFINPNKGKPLLVADDYTFKLNKTTTSTNWICTINGCAAKVHADLNNGLMKTVGNHSHLPETENLRKIDALLDAMKSDTSIWPITLIQRFGYFIQSYD